MCSRHPEKWLQLVTPEGHLGNSDKHWKFLDPSPLPDTLFKGHLLVMRSWLPCKWSLTDLTPWYLPSNPYCDRMPLLQKQTQAGKLQTWLKQVNKKNTKWVWSPSHKWQNFWLTSLIICFLLTHTSAPEVMHRIFSSICILNLVVELCSNRNALPCMLAVVVWANHFLFGLNMIIFSWCKRCKGKHPAASLARLLAARLRWSDFYACQCRLRTLESWGSIHALALSAAREGDWWQRSDWRWHWWQRSQQLIPLSHLPSANCTI